MANYSRLDRHLAVQRLEGELLNTWQSAATLAARTGLHSRVVVGLMSELRDAGKVLMTRARIDGHNNVYMYRKTEYTRVLGMRFVDRSSEAGDYE